MSDAGNIFQIDGLEEIQFRSAPWQLDLTSLDFFLMDHVTNNVYKTSVKEHDELKQKIWSELKKISRETLRNVF
jgi:hypothetical protein